MNLRSFFRVTGLLLVVVAAGLFAYSLHELQEAGWLPFLEATAFDLSASLPDDEGLGAILRGLVGYNADPTWLEVVGWARLPRGRRWVVPPGRRSAGRQVSTTTRGFLDGRDGAGRRRGPLSAVAPARFVSLFLRVAHLRGCSDAPVPQWS